MLRSRMHLLCAVVALVISSAALASVATAQNVIPTNDPPYYGPFNARFLPDGDGLKKALVKEDTVLRSDSPWSLYCWVRLEEVPKGPSLIAGVGKTDDEYFRYLGVKDGKLTLRMGKDEELTSSAAITPGKWQFVAATFNGSEFQVYNEGARVAEGKLEFGSVSGVLQMAPADLPWPNGKHFGGKIVGLTLLRHALTADEVKELGEKRENPDETLLEDGSKAWPVQTRGQAGYRAPQDPASMPRSWAEPQRGVANNVPPTAALKEIGKKHMDARRLEAAARAGSERRRRGDRGQAGFVSKDWWAATVPGTVLTTMIDRGVYPDPDYGLNNLAIPETLNKQDYWYRTEFTMPGEAKNRRLILTFEGINYKADVWLNGKQVGTIKGAFIRGVFDVTSVVKVWPGQCPRGAHIAAAASRNSARAEHQGGTRRKRRNHVPGWADVCGH